MPKILVICFSPLSRGAMTIPVIHSFATQYSQHQIMILGVETYTPLFDTLPDNVIFRGVDLRGEYAGLMGLGWLYNDLKEEKFDAIAIFQNSFRCKYLWLRFKLAGKKVSHIRSDKHLLRNLLRQKHKVLVPQKSYFERCADVLANINCPIQLSFLSIFGKDKGEISYLYPLTGNKEQDKWVGIAPFSTQVGKIYPLSRQERVLELLSAEKHIKIFLFGGGRKEIAVLEKWASRFPNVISTAGKLTLKMELALMSHLDTMLTMDDTGMQLASLVNIPVLSIWGATHPYAGFAGWKQRPEHIIQIDLPCRPCSLSGEKRCFRKDYACLQGITPKMIVQHIQNTIN